MNSKTQIIIILAVIILAAFFGNKILNEILELFNLRDTPEERAEKAAEKAANKLSEKEYWKPAFYQNGKPGQLLITHAAGTQLAKQIHDAIGFFYDNPEQIEAAFSGLKTKSQISHLSEYFKTAYGKDLSSFLREKLDTDKQKEAFARIVSRADNLPAYFA